MCSEADEGAALNWLPRQEFSLNALPPVTPIIAKAPLGDEVDEHCGQEMS